MNGRNFLIEVNGVLAKHGFYTNRYVEAADANEAENLAMDSIRKRVDVRHAIRNTEDDKPVMYLEEICKLEDFDGVESFEEGFAWYKEDETAEESESDEIYEAHITSNSNRQPKNQRRLN